MLEIRIDGDQETYNANKSATFHPFLITMCPTYAFIDRANGKFNRAMGFKKDYAALIAAAWQLDRALDAYLTDPDENSFDRITKLGIHMPSSEASENDIENTRKFLKVLSSDRNRKTSLGSRYISDLPF